MSDKTEAQIEREKQAVLAMSNAKSNMATALERIQTLETKLRATDGVLQHLRLHVGAHSYVRVGSDYQTGTEWIDLHRSNLLKVL